MTQSLALNGNALLQGSDGMEVSKMETSAPLYFLDRLCLPSLLSRLSFSQYTSSLCLAWFENKIRLTLPKERGLAFLSQIYQISSVSLTRFLKSSFLVQAKTSPLLVAKSYSTMNIWKTYSASLHDSRRPNPLGFSDYKTC